jgi:uncharacterized protein (TIGR02453 family)
MLASIGGDNDALRRAMPATAPFTPRALAFLRALKRNNRREWFHQRRDQYEELLRTPMMAVVERFGQEFRGFAPELMADPKKSIYRIWRDTRFSADKRPLKTNVAAVFPHRSGDRHTSAGLYLEIAPEWVFAGGGLYMPDPQGLHHIRERIAADPKGFARVVNARALKKAGGLQGESLKRVPRGFPADHPAADYLKMKQFLVWKEWPPELATTPKFWTEILTTFRATAPLLTYLNDALGVKST